MKLGQITGTVEASAKDGSLTGLKLLLADLIDGTGAVIEPACVAADSCGAGVGDRVLITFNAAARMPGATGGAAVDATIVAVVDRVALAPAKPAAKSKTSPSKKRKS